MSTDKMFFTSFSGKTIRIEKQTPVDFAEENFGEILILMIKLCSRKEGLREKVVE